MRVYQGLNCEKNMDQHLLILGGARSGKSRYAEENLEKTTLPVTYIATAQAFDDEMRARIAQHRKQRSANWETVEAPLDLPKTVRQVSPERAILVDCLTLWLSNLILAERDVDSASADLLEALGTRTPPVVLVSNEVGMGVVPDTPLGRVFRDAQGRLNQTVAAQVGRVVFVAAGLPLVLKGAGG